MIRIEASQLSMLCASHFIAHFDYCDLQSNEYHSDYECEMENIDYAIWCEALFDNKRRFVEKFRFGIEAPRSDHAIEIAGSLTTARTEALELINLYLGKYTIEITNETGNSRKQQ